MSATAMHSFDKDVKTITIGEALEEIRRTRRQLDRFEHLPHSSGHTIRPENAALLRRECDALEAELNSLLSSD